MTLQEQAERLLASMMGMTIQDRIDKLCSDLALLQGEGHTRFTVYEAYSETDKNDAGNMLIDLALKIVEAQPCVPLS